MLMKKTSETGSRPEGVKVMGWISLHVLLQTLTAQFQFLTDTKKSGFHLQKKVLIKPCSGVHSTENSNIIIA